MNIIASHHHRLDSASIRPVKKILVPVDFSTSPQVQIPQAVELAKLLNATLVLLYVAEISPAASALGERHLPKLEAGLRRLAKKQLAKLKERDIPRSVASQSLIRPGRPDCEILAVAKELNVDLIVMAKHSKESRPGQLGTTATRVVSLATCPVMLVPLRAPSVPFFL
jgi:nucleotide-binding universal stress UspA family protein